MSIPVETDLEELLWWLRDNHGSDFTGYKRPSLQRLVERRVRGVGAADVRAYLDLLQVQPAEVLQLLDTLLINVTSLFRDPDTWEALGAVVVERVAALPQNEPIRVWSAACASGEEAYSLAILLHERLGDRTFRDRVKVYATDIDEDALATARAGRYPASALEQLSQGRRDTYFEADGDGYLFRADLRRHLIFGRHDLLQDAPISRVLVLTCRNALMYFTTETQSRVLGRFSFSLHPHGVLMLGRAEMLLTQSALFTAIDLPMRIFAVRPSSATSRLTALAVGGYGRDLARRRVTEAAFSSAPAAQVVLDGQGVIALINERAQQALPLSQADVGQPFGELAMATKPFGLRATVAEVGASRTAVEVNDVRFPASEDTTWDVTVLPLEVEGELLGLHLVFVDVTERNALQIRLEQQTTQLGAAYEELQSSSEELETTNEELQSAVEELETTNEELQSTNEELETMNEELQSTNEELQTLNEELRERTHDVDRSNGFLHAILEVLDAAIVVLDADHTVQLWNGGAERMIGLRSYEVQGKPLTALDLGIGADQLMAGLRAVVLRGSGREVIEIEAIDRTGTTQRRTMTLAAVDLDGGGGALGVVVAMLDTPGRLDEPG